MPFARTVRTIPRIHAGLLIGILTVCSPILLPAPSLAADTPTTAKAKPSAGLLLTRCFRAMGGESRIETIRDLQIDGTIAIGDQPVGTVAMSFAAGNRARVELAISSGPVESTTVFGSDGTTAWELERTGEQTTPSRAILLTMAELNERIKANNWLGRLLHLASESSSMRTIGRQEFMGRDCWAVQLTSDRRPTRAFFDIETRLIVGFRIEVTPPLDETGAPATPINLDIVFSDWKPVSEIEFFHRVQLVQGAQTITITYESISINEGSPERFTLPASIRSLVESTPDAPATPDTDAP